jgi:hypothetical protein
MILTILRLHLSLEEDAPTPRAVDDAGLGPVIEVSQVGGLHHHYERRTVWSAVFCRWNPKLRFSALTIRIVRCCGQNS